MTQLLIYTTYLYLNMSYLAHSSGNISCGPHDLKGDGQKPNQKGSTKYIVLKIFSPSDAQVDLKRALIPYDYNTDL